MDRLVFNENISKLYRYFDRDPKDYSFEGVYAICAVIKVNENEFEQVCKILTSAIDGFFNDGKGVQKRCQPLGKDFEKAILKLRGWNWNVNEVIKNWNEHINYKWSKQ